MTALLVGLLLSSPAGARPAAFHRMTQAQIQKELVRLHRRHPDLAERVAAVSALFLGTPYKSGPLGEGDDGEFDRDPLISFSACDCTTLVEQVMALAMEPDLKKATALLQQIRYREGKISYETRNHFTEADWIAQNAWAGFLEDITAQVDPGRVKQANKLISKRAWYQAKTLDDVRGFTDEGDRARRLERLRSRGESFEDQLAAVPYIPMDALPELLLRVPSGTIANLVREDQPDKPVLVSHQVLLIDKDGEKFVRHAASGRWVEDVPALEYFYRYFGSKWRLLGLNLNRLRTPGGGR